MPYHLITHDGKHCVAREGEDTPIEGGCHDTEEQAKEHMAALYANESDAAKAANLADWVESRIHHDFTVMCDDLFGSGRVTREERIVLSSAIGDALDTFHKTVQDKAAALRERRLWDDAPAAEGKTSLEEQAQRVRGAFNAQFHKRDDGTVMDMSQSFWVADVYPERVIVEVEAGGGLYACEYSEGDDGKLEFAPRDKWTRVQRIYEEVKSGYAVKFIDDAGARIRAYAALWSDAEHPDLSRQRDFFTKSTDFWDSKLGLPRPLTYHHGFEPSTKTMPTIGKIEALGEDELGKWFEAELDKAHKYYAAIKRLIDQGALKPSSDSVPQYVQRERQPNGTHWLKTWPLFGVTLTPIPAEPRMYPAHEIKAIYQALGVELQLPEVGAEVQTDAPAASARSDAESNSQLPNSKSQVGSNPEVKQMDEKEILALIERREREKEERARAEAEAKAAQEAEIERRLQEKLAELARGNRPALFSTKAGSGIAVVSKYDGVEVADLAFLAVLRHEAKMIGRSLGPDEDLLRALAVKSFRAVEQGHIEAKAMDDLALKANEVMQSTLTGAGDEWVFTNYSTQLWQKVRAVSRLLEVLPQQEIPKGYESETIPLEGSDFTFYNVSQAANEDSTMKEIPATVTASKFGTGQRAITVGKLGGRGYVSGELDEDSIIDAIPETRAKLERQLPEELDFVLFNADDTAATDNINGNGTPVAGSDYTVFQGIIRNGLKGNSAANATDFGGLISSTLFRTLFNKLGADGYLVWEAPEKNVVFVDYQTWSKLMGMSDLLTAANAGERWATIVEGDHGRRELQIHGVPCRPSVGVKKAQATGVRHGTESSNTLGRAVLLRPDQWKVRWKRRAKFETTRVARADVTEVVVTLRLGIGFFDSEGSAVGFNVN